MPRPTPAARPRLEWLVFAAAGLALAAALFTCAYRARLSPNLHSEYFNIARALADGAGFADPFGDPTGPTAWQPPLLPAFLAGLLQLGGDRSAVSGVMSALHLAMLTGTGLFLMALARRTARPAGAVVLAAVVFVTLLLGQYRVAFQAVPLDAWPVLLVINLFIARLVWGRPLRTWRSAALWGLLGGVGTLLGPVAGFTWAVLTAGEWAWGDSAGTGRPTTWPRAAAAVLVLACTLAPWAVRNYLVFGRLIPVKTNLAYELYQSQCLQRDGLLQVSTFDLHPYRQNRAEGVQYRRLGETAFLDRKWEQFRQAVWDDPADFLNRVADRFLGAVFLYQPFHRVDLATPAWQLWLNRLAHVLPFLALLVLLATAPVHPLRRAEWVVLAVYLSFLLPYVVISYYDRYAFPLVGAKALLVVWAADRLLPLLTRQRAGPATHSAPPR